MPESRNRAAVSPSPREVASGWVLEAVFPNGKQATITGFDTASEANAWLGSASHVAWLRGTRTAFFTRAVTPAFECLSSCAAILTAAACELLQTTRERWGNVKTHPAPAETLALLLALALACIDGLAQRVGKWVSARPRSVCWRSVGDRCLFAAISVLLAVSAVVAILAAMVVILGRTEHPPESKPVTPQISAARPVAPARSTEAIEISDPIAVLIERMSSSSDAPTEPPVVTAEPDIASQPAGDEEAAAEIHLAIPRHDLRHAAPLGITGVWAPDASSCSARHAREGLLSAIISDRGARAGKTSCVFNNRRRSKSDWRLLAHCTNGHEHWKSNVRLAVKGNRLIWTSERGTQAYIRCRPNV